MGIVIGLLFLGGGVFYLMTGIREQRGETSLDDPGDYLRSLDMSDEEADEFQALLAEPFITRVLRPISAQMRDTLGSVLPGNYRDQVHLQLVYAGLSGQYRAEEIITAQILAASGGLLLALFLLAIGALSSNIGILMLVLMPLVGAQLPRTMIRRAVDERRGAILGDLPDTLDLLALSVEAGVGFEGALGIVAENFVSPLADEFSRTLREMELGLPRREALQNLRKRTEVPELSNFVLALTQADALGMPIGRVLKTQAAEMRTKRRQWAREKAAQLPVKILFPLILFIFPPVFIVVLGPAAAQIGGAL
jgi:tight adherence protein C